MNKNDKPNCVLFKRDDGQLAVVMINDDKFNWDEIRVLQMGDVEDKFDDVSASNPFEFIFCNWVENKLTSFNQKTIVPDYSFSKLYDEGKFENTVELDYKNQYGKNSV